MSILISEHNIIQDGQITAKLAFIYARVDSHEITYHTYVGDNPHFRYIDRRWNSNFVDIVFTDINDLKWERLSCGTEISQINIDDIDIVIVSVGEYDMDVDFDSRNRAYQKMDSVINDFVNHKSIIYDDDRLMRETKVIVLDGTKLNNIQFSEFKHQRLIDFGIIGNLTYIFGLLGYPMIKVLDGMNESFEQKSFDNNSFIDFLKSNENKSIDLYFPTTEIDIKNVYTRIK